MRLFKIKLSNKMPILSEYVHHLQKEEKKIYSIINIIHKHKHKHTYIYYIRRK